MSEVHYVIFERDIGTQVFYKSREAAIDALAIRIKSLKFRGVLVTEETTTKFSYHFGWSQVGGTWQVVSKPTI